MAVTIAGKKYKVVDSGCYSHDFGSYWKIVETADGDKTIVGSPGRWRFWTASDRTRPLREAIEKGWPRKDWGKQQIADSEEPSMSGKIKIEIIKKSNGEVVATKTAHSKKDWEFYWNSQCDGETFTYRYVE
jgi:hypothetical protein